LKQLEDHHGTKLYRRLSKGIEITEAGQFLLRKIMPILDQVAQLETGFKARQAIVARAMLRTGGTFNTCAVLLPRVVSASATAIPAGPA
jgi:DNA-binding transcriptional LysR family regulator